VVVIAGSIGIALTLYSRAATPTVAREAEAGTLSGGAQQLADASASSGQAVKFRPASESTPKRLLGIYYSGGADATSMTDLGLYADISSTYYQPNEIPARRQMRRPPGQPIRRRSPASLQHAQPAGRRDEKAFCQPQSYFRQIWHSQQWRQATARAEPAN
jgi:hypothetical protein